MSQLPYNFGHPTFGGRFIQLPNEQLPSVLDQLQQDDSDRFSSDPTILFDQAKHVGLLRIALSEEGHNDRAGLARDNADLHLHYFSRDTESAGKVDGCEVVAYRCNSLGRVLDWSHRYTIHDRNLETATKKLTLQIVNGLIEPMHIENEVPGRWTIDFNTGVLD